jgi:hypothetical protein
MQIARSATSISWIPSDSIPGLLKLPMEKGIMHYDPPPPLAVTDLEPMRRRGEFRFANILGPGSTSRTPRSATAGTRAG